MVAAALEGPSLLNSGLVTYLLEVAPRCASGTSLQPSPIRLTISPVLLPFCWRPAPERAALVVVLA